MELSTAHIKALSLAMLLSLGSSAVEATAFAGAAPAAALSDPGRSCPALPRLQLATRIGESPNFKDEQKFAGRKDVSARLYLRAFWASKTAPVKWVLWRVANETGKVLLSGTEKVDTAPNGLMGSATVDTSFIPKTAGSGGKTHLFVFQVAGADAKKKALAGCDWSKQAPVIVGPPSKNTVKLIWVQLEIPTKVQSYGIDVDVVRGKVKPNARRPQAAGPHKYTPLDPGQTPAAGRKFDAKKGRFVDSGSPAAQDLPLSSTGQTTWLTHQIRARAEAQSACPQKTGAALLSCAQGNVKAPPVPLAILGPLKNLDFGPGM